MIVKTGANYQAEGGYIEFSADNPNGVTIINDRAIPTTLYPTAASITALMDVVVKKTSESSESIRVGRNLDYTSVEGVHFMGSSSYEVTTTENVINLTVGFGSSITVPSGKKPVLMDGSKDVQIISRSSTYYLFISGADPVAVLSYTEA